MTSIRHKRNTLSNIPTLSAGEFYLATDTSDVYIGNSGNKKIGGVTALSLLVPYTGASTDVDLGTYKLSTTGYVLGTFPYGNMYIYNLGGGTTTVTVSATDTFYQISTGVTGGLCNGFTFQNARELKCLVAGTYKIDFSLSPEVNAANQEVEVAVMVDGTANTSISGHVELANSNRAESVSGHGIVALTVNQLVSLAVLNHTATNNILIDHYNLAIVRVG